MAGVKRHLEESHAVKVKKAKIQSSIQPQKAVKVVKPSKVKKPALPSPDDSSVASEDVVHTSSTNASSQAEETEPTQSIKKVSKPTHQATKTSKPAKEGERVLNGKSLHRIFARKRD
jgi:hypothetical protein